MKKQYGYTVVELVVALGFIVCAGGWVANIVKLTSMTFAAISAELVLRIVGIVVAPLGVVMGFL